jgi:hypothetical protein
VNPTVSALEDVSDDALHPCRECREPRPKIVPHRGAVGGSPISIRVRMSSVSVASVRCLCAYLGHLSNSAVPEETRVTATRRLNRAMICP